jgi:hypothetical protein
MVLSPVGVVKQHGTWSALAASATWEYKVPLAHNFTKQVPYIGITSVSVQRDRIWFSDVAKKIPPDVFPFFSPSLQPNTAQNTLTLQQLMGTFIIF